MIIDFVINFELFFIDLIKFCIDFGLARSIHV